jgi:hypothetical protein
MTRFLTRLAVGSCATRQDFVAAQERRKVITKEWSRRFYALALLKQLNGKVLVANSRPPKCLDSSSQTVQINVRTHD